MKKTLLFLFSVILLTSFLVNPVLAYNDEFKIYYNGDDGWYNYLYVDSIVIVYDNLDATKISYTHPEWADYYGELMIPNRKHTFDLTFEETPKQIVVNFSLLRVNGLGIHKRVDMFWFDITGYDNILEIIPSNTFFLFNSDEVILKFKMNDANKRTFYFYSTDEIGWFGEHFEI